MDHAFLASKHNKNIWSYFQITRYNKIGSIYRLFFNLYMIEFDTQAFTRAMQYIGNPSNEERKKKSPPFCTILYIEKDMSSIVILMSKKKSGQGRLNSNASSMQCFQQKKLLTRGILPLI